MSDHAVLYPPGGHRKKKRKRQRNWTEVPLEDREYSKAIATVFGRVFQFDRDSSWQLPEIRECFVSDKFSHDRLLALKERLNETKALLNDIDIEVWHEHTRRTHVAGRVVSLVREHCGAELCTQAWAKFYEILHSCSLLNDLDLDGKLTSVHLCEAPGAFVTALNHYIKATLPTLEWKWLASTLNPYYEGNSRNSMIDDDGFISNTLEHWHFGDDDSGNLLSMRNISSLLGQARRLGSVRLVTADGSIDCQQKPGEQEHLVAGLHFGEIAAAITLLDIGGAFVLKMFTILEHSTVCLVYLLVCSFEKVSVVKPSASKAGNSEVYLVCRRYCGLPWPFLRKLHDCVGEKSLEDLALFAKSALPPSFLCQIENCERYFIDKQISAIQHNLSLFGSPDEVERQLSNKVRRRVAWNYLEQFFVQPLPHDLRLMTCEVKDGRHVFVTSQSKWQDVVRHQLSGSYTERLKHQQESWSQRVLQTIRNTSQLSDCEIAEENIGKYLVHIQLKSLQGASPHSVKWLMNRDGTLSVNCLQVVRGCLPQSVCSSRFCHPFHLEQLTEALAGAEVISSHPQLGCSCPIHSSQPATSWLGSEQVIVEVFDFIKLTDCCLDLTGLSEVALYFKQQKPSLQHVLTALIVCVDARLSEFLLTCDLFVCVLVQWLYSSTTCYNGGAEYTIVSCPAVPNAHHALSWLCETLPASLSGGSAGIVVGGCPIREGRKPPPAAGVDELSSRAVLLASCISACKLLSHGGVFCAYLDGCLTRWTACLLYILHHCFDQVSLIHLASTCVAGGQQLLICKGFSSCSSDLLLKLSELHQEVVLFPFDNTCLSFIPMTCLYEREFFVYLREHNEAVLREHLAAIVGAEQRWLLQQDAST